MTGAIFVGTKRSHTGVPPNNCSGQEGAIRSLRLPCREFGISGPEFRNNTASAAGGAVFITDPASIWMVSEVRDEESHDGMAFGMFIFSLRFDLLRMERFFWCTGETRISCDVSGLRASFRSSVD